MHTFSRIGVLPLAVLLNASTAAHDATQPTPPAQATPADPAQPVDPAQIPLHDVGAGEPTTLPDLRGSILGLHFLGDLGADQSVALIRDALSRAPELAGVSHLFIHSGNREDALALLEVLADERLSARILHDDSDALRAALVSSLSTDEGVADPDAPVLIVLESDSTPLLAIADDPNDPARFDMLADRIRIATRTPTMAHYNLPRNTRLAVEGYDLVAYFTQGRAVRGHERFTSEYRSIQYRFASAAHRELFAADPERYLPTYGGWCASAMGDKGTKVEIDPTNFKVKDGRTHLFYKSLFADALKDWNKHETEWEPAADANWKNLTKEEPTKPSK